jgi:hypothetical protein
MNHIILVYISYNYNTAHVETPKVDSAHRIQTQYIVPVILSTSLNVLHYKTGFIYFYP